MRTLLIADDQDMLRALIAVTLQSREYRIVEAADGDSALRLVRQERPTLALLDVNMPGLSGVEVCQEISTDADLADTAVIMLTADEDPETRAACLAAGAKAYLTKPFSPLQLLELVDEVMRPGYTPPRPAPAPEPVEAPRHELAAFLFADIRDFTGFTLRHGDATAFQLVERFQQLVRRYTHRFDGQQVNTAGDSVLLTFRSVHQAVRAAMAIREAIREYNDSKPDLPLPVGMGVDVGEPAGRGGDFIGSALNRAARIMSHAKPGQVLATETVRALAHQLPGVLFVSVGALELKGFPHPETVYAVVPATEPLMAAMTHARSGGARIKHAPLLVGGGVVTALLLAFAIVARPPADRADFDATNSQLPSVVSTDAINAGRSITVLIASRNREGAALGTGFVVDQRGVVVTNAHVVAGAERVDVQFADGSEVSGTVVGRDEATDVAVISIPQSLPASAKWGNSDDLKVGDPVVAVGFPAAFTLGAQPSISRGVVSQTVSGLGSQYLQIDASVNPGMSGGPLLDAKGQVVGVVVGRVESFAGRAVQGLGFAIPANNVQRLLPTLQQGLTNTTSPRPAQLPDPVEVVQAYHRFLHAGEFGLAYTLVSNQLKGQMSAQEFSQRFGYAGKLGVVVSSAQVLSQEGSAARVAATVLVSELANGQARSVWHEQVWRLIKEGSEWRLDGLERDDVTGTLAPR